MFFWKYIINRFLSIYIYMYNIYIYILKKSMHKHINIIVYIIKLVCNNTRMSKRVSNKHPLARVSIRHPLIFVVLNVLN